MMQWIDELERRRLFSLLTITGTTGDDAVKLDVASHTSAGSDLIVSNTGDTKFTVKVDSKAISLAAGKTIRTSQILSGSAIVQVRLDLGAGDDSLFADSISTPVTAIGGGGQDTLSGGTGNDSLVGDGVADSVDANPNLADQLYGNDGNDTLVGGTDTYDYLYGGDGNDLLNGGAPDAVLYGEAGNDTLKAGASDGLPDATGSYYGKSSYLSGGDGNDSLVGNAGPDTLVGDDGSDTLVGAKGDDEYDFTQRPASAETDVVVENSNEGKDLLAFAPRVLADLSNATTTDVDPVNVNLGDAANLAKSGARRVSTLAGLAANIENVIGTPGRDTIVGNNAANDLDGGPNFYTDDETEGAASRPLDDGGGGPALLDDPAADSIVGLTGNDTLTGNGPDTLDGGDGNDTLATYDVAERKTTALTLRGGTGADTQQVVYANLDHLNLSADVENLVVDGEFITQIHHVIGNTLPNLITLQPYVFDGYSFEQDGDVDEAFAYVDTVSGGDGNDTIISTEGDDGLTADQVIHAHGGPHTFAGDGGNDLLVGHFISGVDNDTLYLQGGAGRDTLQATGDTAYADYSDHTAGVKVDLNTGFNGPSGDVDTFNSGVTNLRGSSFNDTLIGNAQDNTFDGGKGSDDFTGGAGNDTVTYAAKTAAVAARIDAKPDSGTAGEKDTIRTDIEQLLGTDYNDTLVGSANADTLNGAGGNDSVDGGAGNDTLINEFFGTDDTLIGGPGEDTASAGDADFSNFATVTLDGKANDGDDGTGNVMTENVSGAEFVYGDSGPNKLTNVQGYAFGGAGNDFLEADDDPHVLLDGGLGADTMQGGTADYSTHTTGVAISFNNVADDGTPGEHDDVIPAEAGFDSNFTYELIGTPYNDTLTGSDDSDYIAGEGGNDVINGLGGDDLLTGGSSALVFDDTDLTTSDGNDTFSGGDGVDTLAYDSRTDNLKITFDGVANDGKSGEKDNVGTGQDIEAVISGSGKDSLVAGAYGEDFDGGLGADTFVGGAGLDTVRYADRYDSNDDVIGVNVSLDDKGNDGVKNEWDDVTSSIDRVVGTDGDDTLRAGTRAAVLDGEFGSDTLYGSNADDTLILGSAVDGSVAFGLGGNDTFINQNGSPDTIDGGDGFDLVQQDQITRIDDDGNITVSDDTSTNVEFVYDTIGSSATLLTAHAAGVAAALPEAATTKVISGVSVGVDSKNVLRVVGSAAADTIELDQTGTSITVYVGKTSAGSFTASTLKAIDIDARAGNDVVRLGTAAGGNPLAIGARVHGGDGNDTLTGGNGGDVLAGEGGNDSVNGGAGNDRLSGDFIVLIGEAVPAAALVPDGNDTIIGGAGDTDLVSYTNRKNALTINAAAGTAVSGSEKDKISGVEFLVGSQANDVIIGSAGNDLLFGGPGNDSLTGGAGADQLRSGIGTDSITPDAGNDFIDTGPDKVVDRVVASLNKAGTVARSASGVILFGAFNDKDYFTLSNRYFGSSE